MKQNGPWSHGGDIHNYQILDKDRRPVATIEPDSIVPMVHNANLIAAAPELDASLFELWKAIDSMCSASREDLTGIDDDMMERAHRALIKAEQGE